jgi:hypothetical protein
VHFKSNRGEAASDIANREEAARQLLAHAAEMERAYSRSAKVVTVIAGDFNTDPTDARFASEGTFVLLREKFVDPFLGIGHACFAAKECAVNEFIGFEIDAEYIKIARELLGCLVAVIPT